MRFLTVTVCAIVATLVAAAQVIALEETTLARRQASQSNSLVIVCPPGANTPCDQSVHVVSQTNATAAKNALDMCNAYDESQAGNHNPRVDSAGFDPKKATIMVCSDTYYHGACDHPTITDGECKQMTVGSLGNNISSSQSRDRISVADSTISSGRSSHWRPSLHVVHVGW